MKCDDEITTLTYLVAGILNRKELLKLIYLLIHEYFRESEDNNDK